MAGASKQLGLHESHLYAWRKKARYEVSRSETEKEQAIENAKFKLQLAKQTSEVLIHEKMQTHSASPPSVRSLVYHVAGTIAGVIGWKRLVVAKIASAARSPGSGCLCHPQGP